jgi:hypothetical protein
MKLNRGYFEFGHLGRICLILFMSIINIFNKMQVHPFHKGKVFIKILFICCRNGLE